MKKIVIAFLFVTGLHAVTSDVYCVPMGDSYLYCSDSTGNEWTVFIGE